jgi:hypothetical protein
MTDANRHNWRNGNVQITKQVGNYLDPMNRYLVICKSDLSNQAGDVKKIVRRS